MSNVTTIDVKFVNVEGSFAKFVVRVVDAAGNATYTFDRYRGVIAHNVMVEGQRGIWEFDGNSIKVFDFVCGELVFEMFVGQ